MKNDKGHSRGDSISLRHGLRMGGWKFILSGRQRRGRDDVEHHPTGPAYNKRTGCSHRGVHWAAVKRRSGLVRFAERGRRWRRVKGGGPDRRSAETRLWLTIHHLPWCVSEGDGIDDQYRRQGKMAVIAWARLVHRGCVLSRPWENLTGIASPADMSRQEVRQVLGCNGCWTGHNRRSDYRVPYMED